MPDRPHLEDIGNHYGAGDVVERVRAGLRAAGLDNAATPDDLAPLDQFHIGGRRATLEIAERAGVRAGQTILDIGGGIGGPARTLANAFGCTVAVLDLTEACCRAGELLTALTGLSGLVSFRHADALAMPFPDETFDLVWTQHSSMNIFNKERMYAEIHRVLRPGGCFALHEVMAGPVQPMVLPVPWARDPAISFLKSPEALHSLIHASGFEEVAWIDATSSATAWLQKQNARPTPAAPPPLGIHVLLGPEVRQMGRNVHRNFEEDRITVVQAVFARTPASYQWIGQLLPDSSGSLSLGGGCLDQPFALTSGDDPTTRAGARDIGRCSRVLAGFSGARWAC